MSVGRHAAKRAAVATEEAAVATRKREEMSAEKLRKEKLRAQQMFIRQIRARQGGGFLSEPRDTLG